MKSKTSLKFILFIVNLVGIIFFSATTNAASQTTSLLAANTQTLQKADFKTKTNIVSPNLSTINLGLPIRLVIPKIKVNAKVIYVGLTSDGAMDAPKGPHEVAWFNLGPRPGKNGSAVIAGHYGIWKNGSVSVFRNLHKLKKGDKLYVKDENGATVTFIVRENKIYDIKSDTSKVFISNDGKSHLNLITCVLDKTTKKYSKRLVVFTDKE